MSHQRPIFHQGLYGKANREVMNGILDGVDVVRQYQDALLWADEQMRSGEIRIRWFLATITSATLMDATGGTAGNRWWYSGKAAVLDIDAGTGGLISEATNDSTDTFVNAVNLREVFNNAATADQMDTGNPQVSVGPVGSHYAGGNTWTTSSLTAIVVMGCTYDKAGRNRYFFDRPNPIRCWDSSFT